MTISITNQNKVYVEFDERLFELGIITNKILYFYSNSIDIRVKNICEMETTKQIITAHRKELSSLFVTKWLEHGGEINPEYCGEGKYFYFNISSTQESEINKLIRSSRDEIFESVKSKSPAHLIPKYFFCHSSNYDQGDSPPGYNVVFRDPKSLRQSHPDIQKMIKSECMRILTKNSGEGVFEERMLNIGYFDCTSKHMYGLSRED